MDTNSVFTNCSSMNSLSRSVYRWTVCKTFSLMNSWIVHRWIVQELFIDEQFLTNRTNGSSKSQHLSIASQTLSTVVQSVRLYDLHTNFICNIDAAQDVRKISLIGQLWAENEYCKDEVPTKTPHQSIASVTLSTVVAVRLEYKVCV